MAPSAAQKTLYSPKMPPSSPRFRRGSCHSPSGLSSLSISDVSEGLVPLNVGGGPALPIITPASPPLISSTVYSASAPAPARAPAPIPTPAPTLAPASSSLKQTQHSSIAKSVMSAPGMSRNSSTGRDGDHLAPPHTSVTGGIAGSLTDTPAATAPNSPRM